MCGAALACAQTPRDRILQSSVLVFGTVQENGKMKPVSRGGGFLIDARHVVANLNACCAKTERGEAVLTVVVAGDADKDVSAAKLVWSNADTEIAILELKDPLQRAAIALAPLKTVEKDQAVYTAQFPNPGEKGQVTITEGKVTGLVKIENSDVQVYKTTAGMNKANAGGALFDACGNAIGINMMVKEGVEYAYVIDPLLAGLKAAGIAVQVAAAHCGSSSGEATQARREWRLPEGAEWVPVGLLAAALLMAFRSPRKPAPAAAGPAPMQPLPEPETYVPPGTARPALCGIAGEYLGKSFALEGGPSVLGRDQRAANLVFSSHSSSISKRHCRVSWDGARKTFVLEDLGSTNGTFLSTGERLTAGQPRDLPAGSRFLIGDLRNQFELRVD
jgi:hypothetical protein